MKAKYIGDPRNPGEAKNLPESTEAFGVTFERGKWTDVPDELASKFVGNTHYETKVERGDVTEPEPGIEAKRATATLTARA